MTAKTAIHPELAAAITEIIDELSTELDLHYEDSDIAAVGPTLRKMKTLVAMLVDAGRAMPDSYTPVVRRLYRTFN